MTLVYWDNGIYFSFILIMLSLILLTFEQFFGYLIGPSSNLNYDWIFDNPIFHPANQITIHDISEILTPYTVINVGFISSTVKLK
jgi:hypothetical protein